MFGRDLRTGETSLVSVAVTGTGSGNAHSVNPVISPDGTKVASREPATNLTSTVEPNGALSDLYVRDLDTGVTMLAATSTAGTPSSTSGSGWPVFSPDGTRLAFVGSGLHPLDTTLDLLAPDIYVRDLATGVVDLVTVNATNNGSGNAWTLDRASFSPDGSRLAFTSYASNLIVGDTNQVPDLFVRDLAAGTTTLVSVKAAGTGSGNAETGYGASFSPTATCLRSPAAHPTWLQPTRTKQATSSCATSPPERRASSPSTRPGPTAPGGNPDGTDSDRGGSEGPIFTSDGTKILFESNGTLLRG